MITNKFSSSGLRQTFQRRKILEFLTNTKSHPTAYDIYKKISRQIPNISRTTVYNTVNALAQEGIIKSIRTNNSEMRFDAALEPHCHFCCIKCGNVYDIALSHKSLLKNEIDGHEIKDLFVCYKGICKACKSKNKKG